MTKLLGALGIGLFMAFAAAGLAAPSAMAGPAPSGVENEYLDTLDRAGVLGSGQEQEALELGYLACALRQTGSDPVAGTEVYLGAARLRGLCDYTSAAASPSQGVTCPRSGSEAWSVECSLAQGTLQIAPGIDGNPSAADGVVDQPFLP